MARAANVFVWRGRRRRTDRPLGAGLPKDADLVGRRVLCVSPDLHARVAAAAGANTLTATIDVAIRRALRHETRRKKGP